MNALDLDLAVQVVVDLVILHRQEWAWDMDLMDHHQELMADIISIK